MKTAAGKSLPFTREAFFTKNFLETLRRENRPAGYLAQDDTSGSRIVVLDRPVFSDFSAFIKALLYQVYGFEIRAALQHITVDAPSEIFKCFQYLIRHFFGPHI